MISRKILIWPLLLSIIGTSPVVAMQNQSFFQKIKNSALTFFLFGPPVLAPSLGLYAGFKTAIHTPKTLGKKFLAGTATATGVTWASLFFWSKATPVILNAKIENEKY